jgi:glycosyltransferase 2 family protein
MLRIKEILASKYARLGIGASISFITLYLSGRDVNLKEVWKVLQQANLGYVGLGFMSVGINILSKMFRWRVLLGQKKKKYNYQKLLSALMGGQLINLLIPGRVGDITRVLMLGRASSRTFVFGTVVVEKLVETLAYGLLFLGLLILIPMPEWVSNSTATVVLILLIVGVGLGVLSVFYEGIVHIIFKMISRLPLALYRWLTPRLESALSSFKILKSRQDLFQVVFWTFMVWGTAFSNIVTVKAALKIDVPFMAILLVLVSLQAGIIITASPVGVGVFEYVCVLALGVFGVSQVIALGFGLLLHGLVFLPQVAGGLISLILWSSHSRSIPSTAIRRVE